MTSGTANIKSQYPLPRIYFHSRLLTDITCRLIGELAQLSRRATPDTRSVASTPHPELASAPESESGRGQQEVSSAR